MAGVSSFHWQSLQPFQVTPLFMMGLRDKVKRVSGATGETGYNGRVIEDEHGLNVSLMFCYCDN